MGTIRVAVWGILTREVAENVEILLIENHDPQSSVPYHFNLPGEGVDFGESLHEALHREMIEETGAAVEIGELLFVYDHIDEKRPEVRPAFRCTLQSGSMPVMPTTPDEFQIGVKWVALAELPQLPLLPPIGMAIQQALQNPNLRDRYVIGKQG
jgi:ADP-ribose pyrophosphatase YjhB (NUDIX family)